MPQGRNVFQGGFLGLDNIGVFDRSAPLPTGGHIDQADGTSWMAMYALNLMRIALELAQHNHVYEDIATKFFEHFLQIAGAMNNLGGAGIGLWDADDEFFYDVLHLPDDKKLPLKVRSMVGLIPLFAVETLEPDLLERVPAFTSRLEWFLAYRPDLASLVSNWSEEGEGAQAVAVAASRPSYEAVAEENARRNGVPRQLRHSRLVEVPRSASLHLHRARYGSLRAILARGIDLRAFRRQLELARADLVSGELSLD